MKKVGATLIVGIVAWLIGVVWATFWVDRVEETYFDSPVQLSVAKFLWAASPAIDVNADASRAMKLSWLRATGYVRRKEYKVVQEIVRMLSQEYVFLVEYFADRISSLDEKTRLKLGVQMLTYLTRMEIFQSFTSPALESRIQEIAQRISLADPVTRESWFREVMIHAYLQGNEPEYVRNRSELVALLRAETTTSDAEFSSGAVDFYDGILLCIKKDSQAARRPLEDAAEKLSATPSRSSGFLAGDLNVLLIGKGFEDASVCKPILDGFFKALMGSEKWLRPGQ